MIPTSTIRTDSTTTADTVYIGVCNSIDADETSSLWAITRITLDGDDVVIEHAGGNGSPTNKWSERATLTYK